MSDRESDAGPDPFTDYPCGGAFGCGHPTSWHDDDGCAAVNPLTNRRCPCELSPDR